MLTINQTSLAQLHKKLWKVFSEYIRRRFADANGYVACCSCGRVQHWKNMDAGHFISRNHMFTRYDEQNVHAQCGECNAFLQGNPVGYRQFLIERYGVDVVERLELLRNAPAGFTREGLMMRIVEYKQKIKEMK